MQKLKQNIINLFGQQGKTWLQHLPHITAQLAQRWALSDLQPVSNMSYHYVAKGLQNKTKPVVLKISCDAKLIANEITTLQDFSSHGCIELLDVATEFNAILLVQAIPGESLKSLYPTQAIKVIEYYAAVVKQLSAAPIPEKNHYQHINTWLTAIDKADDKIIPKELLSKAITLKNELLKTAENEQLLHGDLHHDNILQQGDHWLAIDPKGIIGETAFEAAAFDFIHPSEMTDKKTATTLFKKRITLLAKQLNLNPERLAAWVFVRLILSAAWFIEDNGDPSWPLSLADMLYIK